MSTTESKNATSTVECTIPVKGYAASSATEPLKPVQFKRREPGPTDVFLEIKYAGVSSAMSVRAPLNRMLAAQICTP